MRLQQIDPSTWLVTLKWSCEMLASEAYDIAFWFMGKLGKAIYEDRLPAEWAEMSPEDASLNAAKMMLYYATLRCADRREEHRAVALFNSFCFGYSLGANFRNAQGRREMLWEKDLAEILETGKARKGSCYLD